MSFGTSEENTNDDQCIGTNILWAFKGKVNFIPVKINCKLGIFC